MPAPCAPKRAATQGSGLGGEQALVASRVCRARKPPDPHIKRPSKAAAAEEGASVSKFSDLKKYRNAMMMALLELN
jgi:hypothetical protein